MDNIFLFQYKTVNSIAFSTPDKDNNIIISRHSNINRSTETQYKYPPNVICPVRVKVVLDV